MRGIFFRLYYIYYIVRRVGGIAFYTREQLLGRKRKKMKMKRGVSRSVCESPAAARSLGAWPLFREVLKEGRGERAGDGGGR